MNTTQLILQAYEDGSTISLIVESFNIPYKQVKQILLAHKEGSRFKRTFTDEFKKMIAERDKNGVTRSDIAKELEINSNTVKKACETFGQSIKDKAPSDNTYTKIDGYFALDTCPSCDGKRNNQVDENITFCMDCDSEHEYYDDHVMKVNFEYIEE